MPPFSGTCMASGRLSSCAVVRLNTGFCRPGLPERRCFLRLELWCLPAPELPQMPTRVHQREIGQCDIASDTFHLLRIPERKGVVVTRGDQNAVRLDRLQDVVGKITGESFVSSARSHSIAEQGNE